MRKTAAPWLVALALGGPLVAGCHAPDPQGHVAVQLVPRRPPVDRRESPPPAPGPEYDWIPGHWSWLRGRFVWEPGLWVLVPPGADGWIPGYWERRPGGWVWRPGHWKPRPPATPPPATPTAAPHS